MDDAASRSAERPTAARVFEAVWSTMVGVLGTAATATMFRRAARGVARTWTDARGLQGFEVVRDGLDYRFVLPPGWNTDGGDAITAVRRLVRGELVPLLAELTGPVVLRMLERHPDLREVGILDEQGEGTR